MLWYQLIVYIKLTIHWSCGFRTHRSIHIDINDECDIQYNHLHGTLIVEVITQQLIDLDRFHGSNCLYPHKTSVLNDQVDGVNDDNTHRCTYLDSTYLLIHILDRDRYRYLSHPSMPYVIEMLMMEV